MHIVIHKQQPRFESDTIMLALRNPSTSITKLTFRINFSRFQPVRNEYTKLGV